MLWRKEGVRIHMIWLIIMIPCSALLTGIGVYAWKRKEPMWFWSGTSVRADELSDVAAYNRANGVMWIGFSFLFWISTVVGYLHSQAGGICLIAGCVIGIPLLPILYGKIYNRYKK